MEDLKRYGVHPGQDDYKKTLNDLGVFMVFQAGVQIDLNVALAKRGDASVIVHICDHNCTEEHGPYGCPAAFSLKENKGAKKDTLPTKSQVLKSLGIAVQAMSHLAGKVKERASQMGFPEVILQHFDGQIRVQVNFFGGNPEMHPQILELIRELMERGIEVNITTTGGAFFDEKFVQEFLKVPPSTLALSADDLPQDPEELRALAALPLHEIIQKHRKIKPLEGQVRKAYEAIYVAKRASTEEGFPEILFNFVLHEDNIDTAERTMQVLGELFPNCQINAYPSQSAFFGGKKKFNERQIQQFGEIVERMIEHHFLQLEGKTSFQIKPRLHYWLLMKAIFHAYPKQWETIANIVSGYNLWKCYQEPIVSNRFFQMSGKIGERVTMSQDTDQIIPNMNPGCFWNSHTVTADEPVWAKNMQYVIDYQEKNMAALALEAKFPCDGCGFPRLLFDLLSLVAGIADTKVRKEFLNLIDSILGISLREEALPQIAS